jgi:hypothetical protein
MNRSRPIPASTLTAATATQTPPVVPAGLPAAPAVAAARPDKAAADVNQPLRRARSRCGRTGRPHQTDCPCRRWLLAADW